MTNKEFQEKCINLVREYTNEHLDKTDNIPFKLFPIQITNEDVYIVWCCKTLQNHKALLSTTNKDGMYYEITYNGDKNEIYFDAYKKFENRCIKL